MRRHLFLTHVTNEVDKITSGHLSHLQLMTIIITIKRHKNHILVQKLENKRLFQLNQKRKLQIFYIAVL
jgi:hypothetical protein